MTRVHDSAIVHPGAHLADDVEVGPYCLIEDGVRIGAGTVLEGHCIIKSGVQLGCDCHLTHGVILGGDPQDKKYAGEATGVVIGDRNILREFVTIHRATGEGYNTTVGNDNMLMAYCHVGHNCRLGNNIMLSSYVGLSGHAVVEDDVVIGGIVGLHQFVTIGKMVMVGGQSKVAQDIPPFMLCAGYESRVVGVNVVGLRRHGVAQEVRTRLKRAYKLLYRSELNTKQAMDRIRSDIEPCPEIDYLLGFLERIREGTAGRQTQH